MSLRLEDSGLEDKSKKIEILQGYLKYPGESPNVDYKSSVLFQEGDDFSLKLVKHILAMCNAGGGVLVIGYNESGEKKPEPDGFLTQEVVASYETTKLSQFVDKHLFHGTPARLIVHKVPYEGKDYPLVEVFPFGKKPLFCNSSKNSVSGKPILKAGALYFRANATKTVEIASPNEWEALIEQVVRSRQDEFLVRFQALLNDMGVTISSEEKMTSTSDPIRPPQPDAKLGEWFRMQRAEVEKLMKGNGFVDEYFEVSHTLVNFQHSWSQSDLLSCADKAALHNTGWPIGVVLHGGDKKPSPTTDGIKAKIVSTDIFKGFDYWYLREDGAYFFARSFQEDTREELRGKRLLYFDTRIWRIAEGIDHCISLYKSLSVDPGTKVKLVIRHKGLANRELSASSLGRAFGLRERQSGDDAKEIEWSVDVTLDDLFVNRRQYIGQAVQGLLIMFDFFELAPHVIDEVLGEYEKSRMS